MSAEQTRETEMNAVVIGESLFSPGHNTGKRYINARIHAIDDLADGIKAFEFVRASGGSLPAFSAGSHIDVHLPGGLIRQYSLCNSATERHRYVVAVLRDPSGRGGSIAMHDMLEIGDLVTISLPRNHFPLAAAARQHTFIAGGIGITPIMAMVDHVRRRGEPFHLYYCARTPERAAFVEQLQPLVDGGMASLHYDYGKPEYGLDLSKALASRQEGTHLYYCGPAGLLDAIEKASTHWPRESRHCERFAASESTPVDDASAPDRPFDIELRRTRATFTVNPGETIVQVLRSHGVEIETSCCEGYCGTCMTRYISGEPNHRDSVLDEEDREEFIMICCSRSKSAALVLDI
jgi:ferredoxin-NADP reductase